MYIGSSLMTIRLDSTHTLRRDIKTSSGELFAKYRFVNEDNEGYVRRWKIASLRTDLNMPETIIYLCLMRL